LYFVAFLHKGRSYGAAIDIVAIDSTDTPLPATLKTLILYPAAVDTLLAYAFSLYFLRICRMMFLILSAFLREAFL
jgi:hypothetical protein